MAEVVFGWAIRTRTIKRGFWTNEDLAELPLVTRHVFAGLFAVADREGRFPDRPKKIKRLLFPADDVDVDEAIGQLELGGFLTRYVVDGHALIEIHNFTKHQSIHKDEKASTLPPPPVLKADPVWIPRGSGPKTGESTLEPEGIDPKYSESRADISGLTGSSGSLGRDVEKKRDVEKPKRKKIPIPAGWLPNAKHQSLAAELGVDLKTEAEAIVDWAATNEERCVNWDARFSNWLRRAKSFGRAAKQTQAQAKQEATQRAVEEVCDALEERGYA